jgi:hypothetical protein
MIAAKTIGIKTILVPYNKFFWLINSYANLGEILDANKLLLNDITIHFIRDYDQIYQILFKQDNSAICEVS